MAISQRKYDYIIGGAGCAGLSLAWHLLQRKELRDKNIALIDRLDRPANDKTWCFWSTEAVPAPVPIYKSWTQLEVFAGGHHEITALPSALNYHCVRSEYYNKAMLESLRQYHQLDIIQRDVSDYQDEGSKGVAVTAGGQRYRAGHFFKCYGAADDSRSRFSLLQHFKGREIITEHDFFDTRTARLMDFRVEQQNGPTFVYVLPYSPRHALVEYTLFSPELLTAQQYDAALDHYIQHFIKLSSGAWKTEREEFGIIPMADQLYQAGESSNITYMGTAAGLPKASTGYTFSRIHRRSAAVAASLAERGRVKVGQPSAWRFRSYDIMLLDILKQSPEQYLAVFEALFKNNELSRVLRFIDEQTSAYEDIKVMASVPWLPFLSAGKRNADLILKGA
jgi:lycopene beta-cyclase